MTEVGRELKVSELQPRTVVVLWKEGRPAMATVWVVKVGANFVQFAAGKIRMEFIALRCGPELEQIIDDDKVPMKIFEYLGAV
jgi:hypothetical protein